MIFSSAQLTCRVHFDIVITVEVRASSYWLARIIWVMTCNSDLRVPIGPKVRLKNLEPLWLALRDSLDRLHSVPYCVLSFVDEDHSSCLLLVDCGVEFAASYKLPKGTLDTKSTQQTRRLLRIRWVLHWIRKAPLSRRAVTETPQNRLTCELRKTRLRTGMKSRYS